VKSLERNYTVDKINPVSYYNNLLNKRDIGLIAHELAEIYPELVEGVKDDEKQLQSVNYLGLIPILINEIKELKSKQQNNTYTSDSIIKIPDNVYKIDVIIIGAGGKAGPTHTTENGNLYWGGAGGGGYTAFLVDLPITSGYILSLTNTPDYTKLSVVSGIIGVGSNIISVANGCNGFNYEGGAGGNNYTFNSSVWGINNIKNNFEGHKGQDGKYDDPPTGGTPYWGAISNLGFGQNNTDIEYGNTFINASDIGKGGVIITYYTMYNNN